MSASAARRAKEGLEKGIEKGLEQGARDALTAVLRKRFKRVPLSIEKKLAAASRAELERWFDAALDASSLKAVFAD